MAGFGKRSTHKPISPPRRPTITDGSSPPPSERAPIYKNKLTEYIPHPGTLWNPKVAACVVDDTGGHTAPTLHLQWVKGGERPLGKNAPPIRPPRPVHATAESHTSPQLQHEDSRTMRSRLRRLLTPFSPGPVLHLQVNRPWQLESRPSDRSKSVSTYGSAQTESSFQYSTASESKSDFRSGLNKLKRVLS